MASKAPFFIYLVPLLFPVMWVLITYVISRLGWRALAERYSTREPFQGTRVGMIHASINLANYKNSLLLDYGEQGLYLRPVFLFRLFHPPLLIPWSEIKQVVQERHMFTKTTEMTIGEPRIAKITISQSLYRRIQQHYSQYLPHEDAYN